MKLFFIILVLLAYCTDLVASLEKHVMFVAQMNADRVILAKHFEIANNHKLFWNEGLAAKAKNVPCEGSGDPKHAENEQRFYEKKNGGSRFFNPSKLEDYLLDITKNPLQTRIGCDFDYKCVSANANGLCIMGPRGNFTLKDIKKGPLASACGDSKKNEDYCIGAAVVKSYGVLILVVFSYFFFSS